MPDSKTAIDEFRESISKTASEVAEVIARRAPEFSKLLSDIGKNLEDTRRRVKAESDRIDQKYKRGARRTSGKVI